MPGQGMQYLPLNHIPKEWSAAWFRDFIRDVLALADTRNAIEGAGITITGQPGEEATISASDDLQNLLLQSYVLATPSGFLEFERVLTEGDAIDIIDGGANSTITIGVADYSVNLGKLAQLSNAGILGNPVNAMGAVQSIEPEVALSVLHWDGTDILFDLIDHTYISDFDEAAQDAVGTIFVDSTSIDFTYSDATPSITASVIVANPSGLIGMSAVNGTAATPPRSDGRHAIDPAIAPEWTATHGWADNAEIQLGTGNDLRLFHDGTNSVIRNDTGSLTILAGATTRVVVASDGKFDITNDNTQPLLVSGTINGSYTYQFTNASNGTTNASRISFSSGDANAAFFVAGSGRTSAIVTGGPVGAQAVLRTLGAYPVLIGTSNTLRVTVDDNRTSFVQPVRLNGYTVATLPAGAAGDTAYVTDALAPVFGAAVAGGGAVNVPVYYTGAAWFVG